jgi:hypothetical protein
MTTKVKMTVASLTKAWTELQSNAETKIAGVQTQLRAEQAKLVLTASKSGLTDVQIAEAIGKSKGEVGKLIAGALAGSLGFDVLVTIDKIVTKGNGIGVTEIKNIAKNTKLTKAEKSEALSSIGLDPKATRKPAPRKGKDVNERTKQAIATLEAISSKAVEGKLHLAIIAEAFETELSMLKAELMGE